MPIFCWRCPDCNYTEESNSRDSLPCPRCEGAGENNPMVRDYRAESAISTFHPTVDLYANKKARKRRG